MKMRLVVVFIFIYTTLSAQTKVSGKILDENNEPLPYVNVFFKGTTIGTVSDEKGEFYIQSAKKQSVISIVFLGFQTQEIELKDRITNGVKVTLKEDNTTLEEVVIVKRPKKRVKKEENPAYRILKEIWKKKKKNGLSLVRSYQYDQYNSRELGFGNMDSAFVRKVLRKKFQDLKDNVQKNYDNDTYYLPVEFIEKSEKVYGNNLLHKERRDVEGERKIGIHQLGKYVDRATTIFQEIDVYNDNVFILDKTFISPISTTGFGSYDYVLSDSSTVNNRKEYTIHFFPRQKGDLVFKGHMKVADKSFALTSIDMEILKDVNLNFVRDLSIEKTFLLKNDSIYLPKTNKYKGEFTFLTKNNKEKGIYLIKKEKFSKYVFDREKSAAFYDVKIVQNSANQFKKADTYWNIKQDEAAKNTFKLVDKVKSSSKVKKITGTIYTLSDGYFTPITGIQLGNIFTTTARNDVEGIRLRLGFRTFRTNNDRMKLLGYGAYGFKDKKFKYGLEGRYLVSSKPRITIGAAYMDDVEQMGFTRFNERDLIPQPDKGPKAVFVRGDNYFLAKVKKKMFRFDVEIAKNFNMGIKLAHEKISSADPKRFSMAFFDEKKNQAINVTKDVYSDFYLSYQPGRITEGFGVDRQLGTKLHPKLLVNYKKAYKGIFGGNVDYEKLSILYNHPIPVGKFGVFDPTIIAAKTFGKTPLSVLTAVPSNQTYFLTPNTFALLDYYDFVADSSIEGHFEQHFNGLIFNRIPLIKKLGLRSLLAFRAVYGSISDKNKKINRSTIKYAAPNRKPYFEYGFGIENIGYGNLRPLRVDFIWRGDFKNVNGPVSPGFGIRVGFKTSF
ncbi:DUF5686 family protein [Tenacibaculum aiptasiae]|uniref:DUF5686 and carboxypeptidase-like regulatory domain-containing protein n=1 Tax=Tenacibaculum aiptasiae TaxID=426481 RepID=UPI003B5C989E